MLKRPARRTRPATNDAPVALVTGAGKRLGRQIALALGGVGFNVIVNYRRSRTGAAATAEEIRAFGVQSVALRADVSVEAEVKAMVKQVITRFGRIDVLVNSSAIFRKATLETTTDKIWEEALGTNLKGTFHCCRAVAPHMRRQGGGRIVNIASLGGLQAWKEHLPYSLSKAGVVMLTKILARELAPNIHVNAIAPGTIIMPGEEPPGLRHVPARKIPLQRYGKASDIADIVVFLATKSDYITGQIIAVDGGRSVSLT